MGVPTIREPGVGVDQTAYPGDAGHAGRGLATTLHPHPLFGDWRPVWVAILTGQQSPWSHDH